MFVVCEADMCPATCPLPHAHVTCRQANSQLSRNQLLAWPGQPGNQPGDTWLLIKLTPTCIVFSFLLFSSCMAWSVGPTQTRFGASPQQAADPSWQLQEEAPWTLYCHSHVSHARQDIRQEKPARRHFYVPSSLRVCMHCQLHRAA